MLKTDLLISDMHGYYDLLKQIETLPNFKTYRVVFLGDFIDRGPKSLQTLRYAQQMVQNQGALAIRGDHEDMFLGYLSTDLAAQQLYLFNEGETTLKELLGSAYDPGNIPHNQMLLRTKYPDLIEFLQNLPFYYEDKKRLYVHGGLYPGGLSATTDSDKLWLREDYWFQCHQWRAKFNSVHLKEWPIFGRNPAPAKTLVTGHTITSQIHGRMLAQAGTVIHYGAHPAAILAVRYFDEMTRYFIDGGSYVYQNLNAMALCPNGKMIDWWQFN